MGRTKKYTSNRLSSKMVPVRLGRFYHTGVCASVFLTTFIWWNKNGKWHCDWQQRWVKLRPSLRRFCLGMVQEEMYRALSMSTDCLVLNCKNNLLCSILIARRWVRRDLDTAASLPDHYGGDSPFRCIYSLWFSLVIVNLYIAHKTG